MSGGVASLTCPLCDQKAYERKVIELGSPEHCCFHKAPRPNSQADMATKRRAHMVLFPFPGQGHFAAFLSLADLLHRACPSAAVTLVSTPRNVTALRSSVPPTASFLAFHTIPFTPAEHGLPANAESADALAVRDFITLFEASESLHPALDAFVGSLPQKEHVSIIADVFFGWSTSVARRHGVVHAFFNSCGAFGSAVFHSLWSHLPHLRTSSDVFHLPDYPEVSIHRSQLPKHALEADDSDRWTVFLRRQFSLGYNTDAVLINTVEELEPTGLGMLRSSLKLPVWPIGPIVRLPSWAQASTRDDAIAAWLDSQAARSVLYVSFGSQNTIQLGQMMELAMALQSSGRPFVWAIRPPVGFDIKGEFRDEWLPEGFEERVTAKKRGLLIRGWATQVKILAHESTGAFLSHCGWNSVLEGLAHGKPLIGWPLSAEQFYNVKVLDAEWGVCVEAARGNMDCSAVDRGRLAEVVETVMGETAKAAAMRRRVRQVKELIEGARREKVGSSTKALEEFLALALRSDEHEC